MPHAKHHDSEIISLYIENPNDKHIAKKIYAMKYNVDFVLFAIIENFTA